MRRRPTMSMRRALPRAVQWKGPAKAGLEDKFRPHFFDGVATVVAKLFCRTAADFAMFGEKDYQQLLVVRRMAQRPRHSDRGRGRADGARSRRARDVVAQSLSEPRRAPAGGDLAARCLLQAAEKIRVGRRSRHAPPARRSRSLTTLGFKVDYVTARNAETLAFPEAPDEPLRLLAAAWLGKTRLIDNVGV